MPTHRVKAMIDGEPTFKKPLKEILAELTVGGALKTLSPLEYITDRQSARPRFAMGRKREMPALRQAPSRM